MTGDYLLDANAVLTLVDDGGGAERMVSLFEEALRGGNLLFMSVVNWGEVFYNIWQRRGEQKARETIDRLSRLPLDLIPVDLDQIMKASEIKALHKIPYVDCIAAALAEINNAMLVTSDRDFEKLGRRIDVLWLAR